MMADSLDKDRRAELREQSPGQLVSELSEQLGRLVRDEMRLAQLELTQKGKRTAIGAGLFGGGGVVALYGLGAVVAGLVLLLANVVEAWAAALIVGAALFLVAGVLALVGKKKVQQATPLMPEEAIEGIKEDVDVVKQRARK